MKGIIIIITLLLAGTGEGCGVTLSCSSCVHSCHFLLFRNGSSRCLEKAVGVTGFIALLPRGTDPNLCPFEATTTSPASSSPSTSSPPAQPPPSSSPLVEEKGGITTIIIVIVTIIIVAVAAAAAFLGVLKRGKISVAAAAATDTNNIIMEMEEFPPDL